MPGDITALFTASVYVEAMLGLLLLFTWVQNTEIAAVAWWGSAHLLRAGSIALFGMYGRLPNEITIDAANAILLTSFAVTWAGARVFGGRSPSLMALSEGAIVWIFACQMPEVAGSVGVRAFLSAAIIAVYTWMAAVEFWRNGEGQLVSRLPAIFMLFAHGALFLLRTPLVMMMPHAVGTEAVFGSVWLTVLSSEALMFTTAIAFILMAMAKERTAFMHKSASLRDPLTGILNRRGFLVEHERVMELSRKKSGKVAVLLIDLDHFKSINDRFGHAFGDRVLQIFATTAKEEIRSSDFVGRLGGEEFGVVLYGATRDSALAIAERIRVAFATQSAMIDGNHVAATVSIGLVLYDGPMAVLPDLLRKADQALYRAKDHGRNRVEISIPEHAPPENEYKSPALAVTSAARNVA